jgi:hypothetical protein
MADVADVADFSEGAWFDLESADMDEVRKLYEDDE